MRRRTRTRTVIITLAFASMLTSTGAGSANGHADGHFVACPGAGFQGPDATIVARRPGTVIYQVSGDRAALLAAACSGSGAWVPSTPTRFG